MAENQKLTRDEKIAKVIREGHEIAEKMRNAKTIDEANKLDAEVERYTDFVDENFGTIYENDTFEEKDTLLSFELYVAMDWLKSSLEPENSSYEPPRRLFEGFLKDFINCLDSGDWGYKE